MQLSLRFHDFYLKVVLSVKHEHDKAVAQPAVPSRTYFQLVSMTPYTRRDWFTLEVPLKTTCAGRVFIFVMLGAALPALGQTSAVEIRRKALYAGIEKQWQYELEKHPEMATYLGDDRYNHRLGETFISHQFLSLTAYGREFPAAFRIRDVVSMAALPKISEFRPSRFERGDRMGARTVGSPGARYI